MAKRLCFISSHYFPETGAGAKRATATAEYLAQQGWHVTVITLLPNYPQGKIYDGYDRASRDKTLENGVTVVRLRPWLAPKTNLVWRLAAETLFAYQAVLQVLNYPTNILLASSPYMFLGPAGLLAGRLKRAKFVWEVRDLTWQYPAATGRRTLGLDKLLARLMRFTAGHADALVTATEGQLPYFVRRPALASTITNGMTDTSFDLLAGIDASIAFTRSQVSVLYAGLIGYNQALSTLIDCAKLCPELQFTLVGDGPALPDLAFQVADNGLSNVSFTGYVSFATLKEAYRNADILVSHIKQDPVFELAQPSKLWEYMATARPVVHASKDEAALIIDREEIGITVPPENSEALAEALRALISDPDQARALGKKGRAFVKENRLRSQLLTDYETLLEAVLTPSEV